MLETQHQTDEAGIKVSPYDPSEIPDRYLYGKESLRDRFGKEVSRYVHSCHREQQSVEIIELLCPDYPHNGEQFTYAGEMGEGLNPSVVSDFVPRSEMLLYGINRLGADITAVVFRPLVCEIESDLPLVVEKFTGGSVEQFMQKVGTSVGCAQNLYSQRFPTTRVEAGMFNDLMVDLPQIQDEVTRKMAMLLESRSLPDTFITQLDFVANNRNHMFRNLYEASEYEDFIKLAFRQMCNYLAVYKALALRFPYGCIVLNKHTPNEVYVRHNNRLLRNFLEIPDFVKRLPAFNFF